MKKKKKEKRKKKKEKRKKKKEKKGEKPITHCYNTLLHINISVAQIVISMWARSLYNAWKIYV
jgi:hypothetical protein